MKFIVTNHQFLPEGTAFITADDRSFRFGDGIFETMLVVNGKVYALPAHMARMKNGLAFFRFSLDISNLEGEIASLIEKNGLKHGYVRVVVSRGEDVGAMGYMMGKDVSPYYIIQTIEKPFPAFGSISLHVATARAHQPIPCKTNSAMHYIMAIMEAREQGCDNALILDTEGHICETASGNLFWFKDGVLHTPEASLPLIPGTIRKKIIDGSKHVVKEGRYSLEHIKDAEEVFMTNVGGLVTRVSSIAPLGYKATKDVSTASLREQVESDIAAGTA